MGPGAEASGRGAARAAGVVASETDSGGAGVYRTKKGVTGTKWRLILTSH